MNAAVSFEKSTKPKTAMSTVHQLNLRSKNRGMHIDRSHLRSAIWSSPEPLYCLGSATEEASFSQKGNWSYAMVLPLNVVKDAGMQAWYTLLIVVGMFTPSWSPHKSDGSDHLLRRYISPRLAPNPDGSSEDCPLYNKHNIFSYSRREHSWSRTLFRHVVLIFG